MRILIAEDDLISRRVLEAVLKKWGHEVVVAHDGEEAWRILKKPQPPRLAILDWMMPGLDGVEIIRRARNDADLEASYFILLTAKDRRDDLVTGLESGANDYLTKPFDREELRVRIGVGERVLKLQHALGERVRELQDAMDRIKVLSGLIPMCASCKKVRDDSGYWQEVEKYLMENSDAAFSHGLCPDCLDKYYPEYREIKEKQSRERKVQRDLERDHG